MPVKFLLQVLKIQKHIIHNNAQLATGNINVHAEWGTKYSHGPRGTGYLCVYDLAEFKVVFSMKKCHFQTHSVIND